MSKIFMVAQVMEDDGSSLGDIGLYNLTDITFDEICKTKKEPYLQFAIRDKMKLVDLDVCFEDENIITHYNRAYKKYDEYLRNRGYRRFPVNTKEDVYYDGYVERII